METEDDAEGSETMRGYKKTSDGRTTSFFHTELDDQAKQLIGDIAPKKIEKPIEFSTAGDASAWNAAGTFEQKDQTSWATDRLKTLLIGTTAVSPSKNAEVSVVNVNSVTGDAQIVSARGKRKHVCDFTIVLEWELKVDDTRVIDGKISVMDLTTDLDNYEFTNIEVNKKNQDLTTSNQVLSEKDVDSLVHALVKKDQQGLQAKIAKNVDIFVEEFKSK